MFVKQQADELIAALEFVKDHLHTPIEQLATRIIEAFKNGNQVILMGNGGSASDAQHIAAEFVGRFKKERRSFPALALNTNTSTVTAVGNDYGYDQVFSRQIDGFAKPGDIVIGISTSGNSKNVELALDLAKKRGCFTAAFLGKDGGTIKDKVDLPLVVSCFNTPHVQECHIFIGHVVCDLVDQAF